MIPFVGEVVVFDPEQPETPAATRRADDLETLLRASDVLSIHAPLTPETRGLVGAAELALLRPGAVVVNVSRGGIVDEAALADALLSGRLHPAGLDVFEVEPLPQTRRCAGSPTSSSRRTSPVTPRERARD